AEIPTRSTSDRALLRARLDMTAVPPSLANLRRLQWAFLKFSPFHSLDLLAGHEDASAPLSADAAIERVLAGRGGPCHVQTYGWVALLSSLEYRVHVAAATIGAPGDHLVAIVDLDEGLFLSDVGNGHPYDRPLPLDAP